MVEMTNAQLTAEVDALTEKVQQIKDLLALFMVNGLQDAFDGTGNQTYGGGIMRLDKTGIQIKSTSQIPGIFFLSAFELSSTITAAKTVIEGSSAPRGALRSVAANTAPEAAVRTYADASNPRVELEAFLVSSGDGPMLQLYVDASTKFFDFSRAPVGLSGVTSDFASLADGYIWYRSDLFRPRLRSNGITGNLSMEIQSSTAPAIANNGTITTAGVSVARVAPAGAVTGIILAVGTTGGQVCTVVNESVAANTVTFAAAGTSNVADGVGSVIAGLTARRFTWDSSTALWYPTK